MCEAAAENNSACSQQKSSSILFFFFFLRNEQQNCSFTHPYIANKDRKTTLAQLCLPGPTGNFVAYVPGTWRLKWMVAPPASCLSTCYRWRRIRGFVICSEWCSFCIILKFYSEDGGMLWWLERPYDLYAVSAESTLTWIYKSQCKTLKFPYNGNKVMA